jgi:glutamyl-tRNA reductase
VPELVVVGMNYRTAPLPVRERLVFPCEHLNTALQELAGRLHPGCPEGCEKTADEAAILSTCNRCEVYAACDDPEHARQVIVEFLAEHAGTAREELEGALYSLLGRQAAQHLLRVAAGLESLLVGENEILGQVRAAGVAAQAAGTAKAGLNALFRYAVTAGKRVRAETQLGSTGLSAGSLVVTLAQERIGPLQDRTALVIGAGKISTIAARALAQAGLRCIFVANRTYARAQKLAAALGSNRASAVHFDLLEQFLPETDILISSTGAPHLVLHAGQVERVMRQRLRPMLIVDLAVPRDVDADSASIPGVHLVNIDDLDGLVQVYHPPTATARLEAEQIVEAELDGFDQWIASRRSVPYIQALQAKADGIWRDEVETTLRRLDNLPVEQQEAIRSLGKAIANRLLHDPLAYLRELPDGELSDAELQRIGRLLNLPGDPESNEARDAD